MNLMMMPINSSNPNNPANPPPPLDLEELMPGSYAAGPTKRLPQGPARYAQQMRIGLTVLAAAEADKAFRQARN